MAKKEDGTIYFDADEQKELDRIIAERLSRVKTPDDYDDLKNLADEIGEFFEGSTPAEKKAAVKAYKEDIAAQKELEELQAKAKHEGTSPELLKEIQEAKKAAKDAQDKLAAIEAKENAKNEESQKQKQAEEAWNKQVKEFSDEFPDVDLGALEKNEKFIDFIEGSGWTLKQAYSKFSKVYGEAELEAIMKVKSKEERSTSSGKGASSDGQTYGLTDRQKEIAKQGGMTFKEYAEILKKVQ